MQRFFLVTIFVCITIVSMDDNTVFRDIVKGAAGGIVDTMSTQPLTYFKVCFQRRVVPSRSPMDLWSGAGVVAVSQVPTTAVQVVANTLLLPTSCESRSATHELLAASASGALSAFVNCPAEHIMTLRQSKSDSSGHRESYRAIVAQHWRQLLHALAPTVVREAGYASGYLALRPIVRRQLEPYIDNELLLTAVSGTSAGITVGLATHSADTIKTRMHTDPARYSSSMQTARIVCREEGVRGLFRGLGPRTLSIILGVTVLGAVVDNL